MYKVEEKLKKKLKEKGLTMRDIANILKEPPGTVGNRLNGFIPLKPEHRFKIEQAIMHHTALNK